MPGQAPFTRSVKAPRRAHPCERIPVVVASNMLGGAPVLGARLVMRPTSLTARSLTRNTLDTPGVSGSEPGWPLVGACTSGGPRRVSLVAAGPRFDSAQLRPAQRKTRVMGGSRWALPAPPPLLLPLRVDGLHRRTAHRLPCLEIEKTRRSVGFPSASGAANPPPSPSFCRLRCASFFPPTLHPVVCM